MTSTIDPSKIGKPVQRARRHVRSLTGYKPETDEKGQEKWPRGDEKVWKDGLRGVDKGVCRFLTVCGACFPSYQTLSASIFTLGVIQMLYPGQTCIPATLHAHIVACSAPLDLLRR